MALLEAELLRKTYRASTRHVEVLVGASFTVGAGETVGILGPSGSGKSTIGQIIAGLIRADAGIIRYRGRELHYPLRGQQRREL